MASSTELSTTSQTRWCIFLSPVEPMYMAGRNRTASRPPSTLMDLASYWWPGVFPVTGSGPFLSFLLPIPSPDERAPRHTSRYALPARVRNAASQRLTLVSRCKTSMRGKAWLRTSPYVALPFDSDRDAIGTRRVTASSHLAQRDVAKTSLTPSVRHLAPGAEPHRGSHALGGRAPVPTGAGRIGGRTANRHRKRF